MYFAYHAVQGNNGLKANIRLREDLVALEQRGALIREQRDALAAKVQMLHPESLDTDYLDEQARDVLGYAHENDVVILDATR